MTPEQNEVIALINSGMTVRQAADRIGISYESAKSRYKRAKKWMNADPSARNAATAAGADIVPHSYWIKTDGVSAYFKTPHVTETESLIDRVSDAFKDIPPYVAPNVSFEYSDFLTVYPMFDMHIGMYAWGDETGGDDYDLDNVENDIKLAFTNIGRLTPVGGSALLILGGDTLHADNQNNETPKSKHKLDVDGRQHKVLETSIRAISWIIEHLAYKHDKVTVRVLAGNHDPSAHLVLTFALAERYRDISRIVIDKSPMDLLMFRWGNSLIAAHHGDKSPPQRLAMMVADVCNFWSEVRHRYILTGHVHHESAKDFPGVKWESLRAFCPPDAFGAGYAPRRAMQAMVFDSKKGRVMIANDPIERE